MVSASRRRDLRGRTSSVACCCCCCAVVGASAVVVGEGAASAVRERRGGRFEGVDVDVLLFVVLRTSASGTADLGWRLEVVVVVGAVDASSGPAVVVDDFDGGGSAFGESTGPRHALDWFLRRSDMGLESVELSICGSMGVDAAMR